MLMWLNSMLFVVIAFVSAWLSNYAICAAIVFSNLYILCYANFYLHFIMNDYNIVQDIAHANMLGRKYNQKMEALRKEITNQKIEKPIEKGELSTLDIINVSLAVSKFKSNLSNFQNNHSNDTVQNNVKVEDETSKLIEVKPKGGADAPSQKIEPEKTIGSKSDSTNSNQMIKPESANINKEIKIEEEDISGKNDIQQVQEVKQKDASKNEVQPEIKPQITEQAKLKDSTQKDPSVDQIEQPKAVLIQHEAKLIKTESITEVPSILQSSSKIEEPKLNMPQSQPEEKNKVESISFKEEPNIPLPISNTEKPPTKVADEVKAKSEEEKLVKPVSKQEEQIQSNSLSEIGQTKNPPLKVQENTNKPDGTQQEKVQSAQESALNVLDLNAIDNKQKLPQLLQQPVQQAIDQPISEHELDEFEKQLEQFLHAKSVKQEDFSKPQTNLDTLIMPFPTDKKELMNLGSSEIIDPKQSPRPKTTIKLPPRNQDQQPTIPKSALSTNNQSQLAQLGPSDQNNFDEADVNVQLKQNPGQKQEKDGNQDDQQKTQLSNAHYNTDQNKQDPLNTRKLNISQDSYENISSKGLNLDFEKLIEEELNRMGEDLYEGGENDLENISFDVDLSQRSPLKIEGGSPSNQHQESQASDYQQIDPDEEPQFDSAQKKVKYIDIPDWRKTHNFFTAFITGKLRKNDYNIIFSQILGISILAVGAKIICDVYKNYDGITFFVPFLHYGLAAFSHIRTLSTDAPMNLVEYLCFFIAYFIQYGWGIANLYLTYDGFNPANSATSGSGRYIVINLFLIPFITSSVAAGLKWMDSNGKFTPFLTVQIIITLIQGLGILICNFVFLSWQTGLIAGCIIAFVGYIGFQGHIYLKNENYLPKLWYYINLIGGILLVSAAFIISLLSDRIPKFLGFTISVWLLSFLLFLYGYGSLFTGVWNLNQRPVFYSPWIFPIFHYSPKKKDLISYNLPTVCLIIGYILLMLWSIIATLWLTPVYIGVSSTIIITVLFFLTVIFIVQISHHQLFQLFDSIDGKILRRAWLEAKSNYVQNRNAFNREELVTYEEMLGRRDIFRNKIRLDERRNELSLEEKIEGVSLIEQVREEDLSWVNTSQVNLNDPMSCILYLYDIEKELYHLYNLELELIIMFQLLIIKYSETLKTQKRKYLFTFLNEKRVDLLRLGIIINIPTNTSFNVQFAKVVSQIQCLPPEKLSRFNHLREEFILEQRALEDKQREAAQIEEEKARQRQDAMANIQKERKDKLKENQGKPLEEWVDCWEKYTKIIEQFKITRQKFTDNVFKADQTSLGENCQHRGVELWVRASQHPDKKCKLYGPTVSCLDVVQGALGDCYFLSAISVLGEKNVQAMIKTGSDEWEKLGCFCVRFFRDNTEEFVIIDDFFPARKIEGQLQWTFVSGGDNGDELWPMVLEKAYAKLYGSYQFIEAGKVQYALADMVEGFPEQMDLKTDAHNLEVFWEKLKILKRQNALMGAGSPENAMGDSAINQMGIVQGHAYALLDVQQVDDKRLVKLRNPHGKNGAEWNGDWSDSSSDWSSRMQNKLKYVPNEQIDGVFWMEVSDFTEQYAFLYICRILDQSTGGWKKLQLSGEWKGITAEGLPSKANPSARLELNPQFEITINRPCDCFILLKQFEPDPKSTSTFKGKNQIFFMVSKNKGQRIQRVQKDLIVCRSGNPINLNMVSSECDFDKSVSYPYKFTLLVANTSHGVEGEGTFEISVYSTDAKMQMKPLPEVK